MRLSNFILENLELILRAWADFARTVDTPQHPLADVSLRNQAEHILRSVAQDMRTHQTEQQQIDKSHGLAPASIRETAAQTHAVLRLMDGFTLDQMVSEYRALRSSVLRLWLADEFGDDEHHVQDMIRFNEAIDQVLGESIASYGKAVEVTRKTVLGVLGHDLRSPLSAVLMGADLLRKAQHLADREKHIAAQIATSVGRANQMVNDLLDLARCNLGTGIPVKLETTELSGICKAVIDELRAGHPSAQIRFTNVDKIVGQFDPARMSQVFSNLVGNAVRHGDTLQPIQVALNREAQTAILSVKNFGEPIPESALPFLFSPEGRYSRYSNDKAGVVAGLGLGLFIAAEIVSGHGGQIEVESTQQSGTTFRVILPCP